MVNLSLDDLSKVYQRGADLLGADLSKAILDLAELIEADSGFAYLSEANLSEANLSEANLSEAKVTVEQLDTAKSLQGATMPDGSKHPWCTINTFLKELG